MLAVYTNLNEVQIVDFLKLYDIGELISFSGITEGIENSNFHIKTSNGNFNSGSVWPVYVRLMPGNKIVLE